MTVIINKYIGITHPVTGDGLEEKQFNILLEAWKHSNCIQGIHLWDEVWSNEKHVLHCDACGIEIHIEKVFIPDGKDDIIGKPKDDIIGKPNGPELIVESEI